MPDSTSQLSIVVKLVDQASSALKSMSSTMAKDLGDIQAQANKVRNSFGIMGGVIVAGLGVTVKAAADAEAEMAIFNQTLANTKGVSQEHRDAMLAAAQAAIRLGYDDEQAAVSIARLYQRTEDASLAIRLHGAALDLARAKGMDLNSATNAVSLALSGQGRALAAFGIAVKDLASPMEVLEALQSKVGGQAEAFAGTFQGQTDAMTVSLGNLQETIGVNLIPVLNQLLLAIAPILTGISVWIAENPELTKNIIIGTAAFGALALAIAALATVLSATITVVTTIGVVIGALSLPLLLLMVTVGLFATFVITRWNDIKVGTQVVWEAITSTIKGAVDYIIGLVNGLFTTVSNIVNNILGAIRSVGAAASPAQSTFSIGGGFGGGFGGSIIPKFAAGGIVTGPTLGLIGEAGPEAVIPLSKLGNMGTNVTINVTGNTIANDMDVSRITERITHEIVRVLGINQRLSI